MRGISKSKYCSAVQCPKMLWLKMHKPEEFDQSVMNEAVLQAGNEVGDLAMGLFGPYTEVPYDNDNLSSMLECTRELIENGTEVICEASFAVDNLFCSVDILKNLGDNRVELYEVKSSTEVKDIYRADVAFQRYILKCLGYTVTRACLVHINNEYVRCGELNIEEFFTISDLTDELEGSEERVEKDIAFLKEYLELPDDPDDEIGERCFKPYECGFWNYCTRHLPKPNVFDVAGMRKSKMFELYYQGIFTFDSLMAVAKLNKNYLQQVQFEAENLPPYINPEAVRESLAEFTYPMYFLDFETVAFAIPQYDNTKPFQQVPFQYSLDWYESEGAKLSHSEFLAYPGKDPRRDLAEQLCRDIPLNVCTVAYNMGFEKGRIREMADLFPDLSDHLMNIHDHIVDLMTPFQKRAYYMKEMEGSYSIKYVLPALFPDDPELNYHNLTEVHNGGEASATFERMGKMSPEELEESRKNMLKYCGLDTYAMVKIFDKIKQI